MGNAALVCTGGGLEDNIPIMVIVGHLKTARNVDVLAGIVLAVLAGVLFTPDQVVNDIFGWLAAGMTFVDAIILTVLTRHSSLTG